MCPRPGTRSFTTQRVVPRPVAPCSCRSSAARWVAVLQADIGIVLGLDSRLRQVLQSAGIELKMLVAGATS